MNAPGGKILIIRGGAIGDFILTLPAIAALRQQFPQAYLEVLGYPHIIQLAVAGGLVDHARSIDARPLAAFFARNGVLGEDMADYFSEFDLIVSYLYDPDGIFRTNVARCSPAQFIAGPHRPDERSNTPAAQVYLRPLERLAIFEADPVPRLKVNQAAPEPGVPNQLALHPGSGSQRKNWPEHRWVELLQQLIDSTAFNLLLIGGEAEGPRLQRLGAALPTVRARVLQNLPLADLARALSLCAGFIGHDSGITHLAAAVGLPGLALWADTAEEIWRPPSPAIAVLRHPGGLAQLSVGEVMDQLKKLVPAASVG